MLGEVETWLNKAFLKFTGFSCSDTSAKLALLCLRHDCAVMIKAKFANDKSRYEIFAEVMNWETGRLNCFIADYITPFAIACAGVERVKDVSTARRRNDCCDELRPTAVMCSFCRVAFCSTCTGRVKHFDAGAGMCACFFQKPVGVSGQRRYTLPARQAAYMAEIEPCVFVPVFPQACFRRGKAPVVLSISKRSDVGHDVP
jgi:hypothetical protein